MYPPNPTRGNPNIAALSVFNENLNNIELSAHHFTMPALDRLAHIVLPKLKIQGGGLSNLTKQSDKLVHVFRLRFLYFFD